MKDDVRSLDLIEDGLFTVEEIAKTLNVSVSAIYKLLDRGELSYLQVGGAKRIPKKFFKEFIEKNLKISK